MIILHLWPLVAASVLAALVLAGLAFGVGYEVGMTVVRRRRWRSHREWLLDSVDAQMKGAPPPPHPSKDCGREW